MVERLFPTTTTALTEQFLQGLRENYQTYRFRSADMSNNKMSQSSSICSLGHNELVTFNRGWD